MGGRRMRLIGHLLLIAIVAVVSWWFLLKPPGESGGAPPAGEGRGRAILLNPAVSDGAPPEDGDAPALDLPPDPTEETAPPPPEAGIPDGAPDEAGAPGDAGPDDQVVEESADAKREKNLRSELEKIGTSKELMSRAGAEVTGRARRGFRTTFLCSARDQLAIARYFGEPVVLVPRSGLDPKKGHYYRLDLARDAIEEVRNAPPLTRYRQYRDLFAFSYESLPTPLRELRRRVFVRGDVYLFAALIPPREWGLVIVRREAALATCNHGRAAPRSLDDVRGFTMRYERLAGGTFDIRVKEIQFADGSRYAVPGRP